MKGCELCSKPARIHCEADGASLCSNCDDKVHSANFIVAKHSRNLLCHFCQSLTPWKASGPKLGRTVSVCDTCVRNFHSEKQRREAERAGGCENDEFEVEDECSCDEEDGELSGSGEGEDEEGGDNQVVPWSCSTTTPPPSPVASSSSSEAVSSTVGGGGGVSALKRTRENADLDSEDEIGCISSQYNHDVSSTATSSQALDNREANSSGYFKSVKLPRRGERKV
jgi:hypothetical protein